MVKMSCFSPRALLIVSGDVSETDAPHCFLPKQQLIKSRGPLGAYIRSWEEKINRSVAMENNPKQEATQD
jgi:hypothetical protein